ncbi:hypothetical protein QR680_010693 [Steinernema hermaphroditum]|uniref:Thioredoxin domain-containing protein n=1 Tax=Steinernema hermaphroditum TaxID=289476 RepID=A0AA39IR10_9BILA|nr:hypothetical protein QR680_010693 [Steinernema hermaphroditum]
MSWPITSEETIQNQSRSFVTFWTEGSVQDISLSCEISGIVPQHNFARICDQSNQIRISESTTEAHLLNQSRVDTNSQPLNPEDDLAKGKLLELKGRCFTATLLVQSHTESCPWCPDTQHIAPGNDQQIEIFGYFIQSDECWYILAILVLSVVTVIMIAIAVYQFVVHWRLKSQQPRYYQKASPNPYIIGQHSPVSNDVIRITGSGLRYDTEGQANSDRSSRLSTISNFTPLDSSSVKGDASPVYASIIREVPAAKKKHVRATAAEDAVSPSPPAGGKKTGARKAAEKNIPQPDPPMPSHGTKMEDYTIEYVDEDKIDEILRDTTKNLVIFFYDGKIKCPDCGNALSEIEEIDDDIEATGYIEVVKTDDRGVAREFGITTFPSLVYMRRKRPIYYDGDFKDSEDVLHWIRSHEEVVTWDLTDDSFEDKTDSYSPDEGTLDWFVMFYDADEPDCNAFVAVWETVAHKLRGLVHVGKVDTTINDDVMERFRLDDDQCPTFILFHRGKMYRYNDAAKDVKSFVTFAMTKFKDQRGHRVPEPPTALEHFYEHVKERLIDALDDSQTLTVVGVGGLIVIVAFTLLCKAYRIQKQSSEKSKTN